MPNSPGLTPVDPHDPSINAVQLARHLDQVVRAMNYATRPRGPASGQRARRVRRAGRTPRGDREAAAGDQPDRLCPSTPGAERPPARRKRHAGDPRTAIVTAAVALHDAAGATASASTAVGEAQAAISGLSSAEPTAPNRAQPATARRGHAAPPGLDR
jgi:hypothetical protein